jgi:hypothetical protein
MLDVRGADVEGSRMPRAAEELVASMRREGKKLAANKKRANR